MRFYENNSMIFITAALLPYFLRLAKVRRCEMTHGNSESTLINRRTAFDDLCNIYPVFLFAFFFL